MWMWRKFCDLKYYHDYLVYCTRAKMLLNKHEIPFEERLVTDLKKWISRKRV